MTLQTSLVWSLQPERYIASIVNIVDDLVPPLAQEKDNFWSVACLVGDKV